MIKFLAVVAALLALAHSVDVQKDVVVSELLKDFDLTTQIAFAETKLSVENSGSSTNYIIHAIFANDQSHLAFIEAKVDGQDAKIKPVKVTGGTENFAYFQIDLPKALGSGGKAEVVVSEWYEGKLQPFPAEISQSESQFVVFEGNAYGSSPYAVKKSKTVAKLSQGRVESFTKVSPSESADSKITYGYYENVEPNAFKKIRIHYENFTPFLRIRRLERIIEVSHWGNIAVEEHIQMEHVGAKLKGTFSRFDYQRDSRHEKQPSIASFKTLLPASARDVYYRDEIGNISTSALRSHADSIEVMIRPRFPLFGGWKTNYVIGYNVPSYEYLFTKSGNFLLRMRLLDHVYDNMVVDELVVKIILPEKVGNVQFKAPYDVKQQPIEMHYTYLDYWGRPVITVEKKNLVEKHIATFDVTYTFDKTSLIYEPLMLVAAFVIVFASVIAWVRVDFTIAADTSSEQRAKVHGLVEQVADAHALRDAAYHQWISALRTCADNKDLSSMTSKRKKAEIDARNYTSQITDLQSQIKPITPDVADKLNEVTRLDKAVLELLSNQTAAVERFISNKMQKPQYQEAEKVFKQKFEEASEKQNTIVYSL